MPSVMSNGHGLRICCQANQDNQGATAKDNRLFVNAVLFRYRAGIPWRDLPERFGNFRVVHTRYSRWSKRGVCQRLFETLAQDADNEYAMIDSTIVRAHQHIDRRQGLRRPCPAGRAAVEQRQERRHCFAGNEQTATRP